MQAWWPVPLHASSPSVLAMAIVKSSDDELFPSVGLGMGTIGDVSGGDLRALYCINHG